jgi:hypothetical protein
MTESKVIALSRFRADVSRALARRAKDLLTAKNIGEQVEALAPLEAYFIVKELGLDEATGILAHATPEQLQTFVDLDCWTDDAPDPVEIDAWLAPFAAEGQEVLARAFATLESELQVLFLAASLTIYDTRSEEVPEPENKDVVRRTTADSFFVVEPTSEEREVDPLFLIDALYKANLDEAFRLLMAAKWEEQSTLEEQALQFREARLGELGFPSRTEALRIFSPPPSRANTIQHFADADATATLPALYASALGDSLIARAMTRISDAHAVERLERDFVFLVNNAVVGYGGSPRDLSHVREVCTRVRDVLSLGLEVMLSPNEPLEAAESDAVAGRAAELLLLWPLSDIFRHGNHASAKLARRAKELTSDPVVAKWLDTHETERDDYSEDRRDRAFVRALLGRPPLLGGFDAGRPDKVRAFASHGDLRAAMERLEGIATRVR